MDKLVIYPKPSRLILIALASLGFTIQGILMGMGYMVDILPDRWQTIAVVICTYIGVPFFGLCFFYASYRIIKPKPSLVIDEVGIYDDSSAVSCGLLKWDEIEDIWVENFLGQKFLGINPKDYAGFLAKQNKFKQCILRINKPLVSAPVNIPQTTIAMPLEDILKVTKQFKST